jgi:circadian clock protein KaiC
MERVQTGIAALDHLLQGGIPAGAAVLVVGRPGSGKTILAHQIMFHNGSPEAKAIYLTTLAEPQIKVMKFQQEFSFFDASKFQRSVIYHDLGSHLRMGGPSRCLEVLDDLLQKHQPSLIILDTIKTLADMISSVSAYREFLTDLSLRLATWGCTALLLGEYSEEEIGIRPESAIADGIIYLSGTEERQQQKRFLRILKMRGTAFSGGETFFKITGDGLKLFPRLNPELKDQVYDLQTDRRFSTGVAGLDEMTDGGYPMGTTTLLSGATGTGKTLLSLHFAYAGLAVGEPVIYVTFEENPRQIVRDGFRIGLDLQPYIDNGLLQIVHSSPMELDLDEHVFMLQSAVREMEAKRLIIDSITAFEVSVRDPVKYIDYMWSMTDFFKTRGVTVQLNHEVHDSANVTELTKHAFSCVADNIVALRYIQVGQELRRAVRVVKVRGSAHGITLKELVIGPGGVTVADGLNVS